MRLAGKVAIVTGGARGMGEATSRLFAAEGAKVVIADVLDREGEALAASIGSAALFRHHDVTDEASWEALTADAVRQFGGVDVLVNNAGVIQVGPIEVMTTEDFEMAMKAHFWGPLYTTMAVLPSMRQKKSGRIVNISSIGGKVSVPHLVPYSASKFALVGLSKGLRAELMKDGIKVTTVCPGLMRTGSPRNADFKGKHQLEYAWFSISDALPLLTVSAENAARQVVRACKRGQAELVISIPAKVAVMFDSLFPELSTQMLALVNQFLPEAGGVGTQRRKGKESTSAWSPSWLTTLNEAAAERNNEVIN